MNQKKIIIISSLFCVLASFICVSCTKTCDCFDQRLFDQHKNDACTEEWRGVKGCDGKLYGNECQANALGIAIVK
jgi:hypothetical protein